MNMLQASILYQRERERERERKGEGEGEREKERKREKKPWLQGEKKKPRLQICIVSKKAQVIEVLSNVTDLVSLET